eukprot:178030-Chlamydomonas_euryale.AAC.10
MLYGASTMLPPCKTAGVSLLTAMMHAAQLVWQATNMEPHIEAAITFGGPADGAMNTAWWWQQ